MCGRFTITRPAREVQALFDLPELPDFLQPRYNAAPSQMLPVVGLKPGSQVRGCVPMRWGFVPSWAADPKKGLRPINAKAETIDTNKVFRTSFRNRRCLIPMDGFYEWLSTEDGKQPYLFSPVAGLAGFAGIWDVWKPKGEGDLVFTFAIITTVANEKVRHVHDRMPVILRPERFTAWLDPTVSGDTVREFLTPYPAELMSMVAVPNLVNSVKNDSPDCIEPMSHEIGES